MLSDQQLRELCLLAAAGGLAQTRKMRGFNPFRLQRTLRCVLYLLVAFSLRRQNPCRRDARSAPDNPNPSTATALKRASRAGVFYALAGEARTRICGLAVPLAPAYASLTTQ
jgi:hypothetical protein